MDRGHKDVELCKKNIKDLETVVKENPTSTRRRTWEYKLIRLKSALAYKLKALENAEKGLRGGRAPAAQGSQRCAGVDPTEVVMEKPKGKLFVASLNVDPSNGEPVKFVVVPEGDVDQAAAQTLLNGSPGPAFSLNVDADGVGTLAGGARKGKLRCASVIAF